MDEVADEVRAGGEEERIGVRGGQLDVGGVLAVGEVEEEAVGGDEEGVGGGGGEGRDDGGDLEHRGAVLPRDALVGVHGLEELEQHTRRERRHGYSAPGTGTRGGGVGEVEESKGFEVGRRKKSGFGEWSGERFVAVLRRDSR